MNSKLTRRQFLGEFSCAAIGSTSILSALINLKMANNAAAASLPVGDDRKTLVCIMLAGGCDSFNLLVRRDAGYSEYSAARTDMALSQGELLSLSQDTGNDGILYGLHPSCPELVDMFNGSGAFSDKRRLAFIANIGTLVEPTTLTQYQSSAVPLPKALFSHIDQIHQWQTSVPQGLTELTGWAGRMADVLHSSLNTGSTAMSISLAGNNVFQIGNETSQFSITGNGALLPSGGSANLTSSNGRKNYGMEHLLAATYNNMMQDALAQHMTESREVQEAFKSHYDAIDDSAVSGLFPSSKFGQEMRAAAKTIAARASLGLRRNTIYVSRGGWDHHGELLVTQAGMLDELSQTLSAYQQALEYFGVADEVITYTASDFGRTLRSNGRGTDHAWGGVQMVLGGPVQGGKVYGTFPSLTLDGVDDVGQGGRILPSTSVDELFAELACWFGVSAGDMPYVLPNLSNFVNIGDTPQPVGFIRPDSFST
ncbi:DUF1501 domain-containing protein [Rubellicoccus peritrichatus]|uniref:DUF1501 domain-containing protein n=1 Tax=Rubellicoccus peritrichatus TaxID=3080537 RepID=A0AAQ3LAI4_9BACT|nr:DUF1501 domain-containing protein [Puniceicoccus sp. CR14]WOO42275.1 DUF1501 domain-containing protein [Puniceicoccus sp. CR14]